MCEDTCTDERPERDASDLLSHPLALIHEHVTKSGGPGSREPKLTTGQVMPTSSNQALQPFTIAPQAGLCPAEGASSTPRSLFFVQQIYVYIGFTHHLHTHTHLNALALCMEGPEPRGYSSHEKTQPPLRQHNLSSQSFPKAWRCVTFCIALQHSFQDRASK